MDIESLQKGKAHLIDNVINRAFKGDVENLHDAISYHMETGGKRLRPLLSILTYEALGGRDDKIIPFAASCEILHNWFLIHDDIEDGDLVRRDKPALWVRYGLPHGVNVGDYMAHKVFEIILESEEYGVDAQKTLKLVNAMVEACLRTSEGQAMDMNMRMLDNPTEEQYLGMIQGKTGHYLTVTMVGAAILADREDLIPRLLEFGRNLGAAFQITDDILDMTEGKGRGEIGRDIKEGKRSLLVVHCLQNCTADEKSVLLGILNKPPEDTTSSDVEYAKSLFMRCGSVSYATQTARHYSDEAKHIADSIPELREIMNFFADYIVQRRK